MRRLLTKVFVFMALISAVFATVFAADSKRNLTLESGKPLPAGGKAAPFSGPGLGNKLLGTAYVNSNPESDRPDIFIQYTEHFSWKIKIVYYSFEGNHSDGRAIFGQPIYVQHDIPKKYTPKYLFQNNNNKVYCIWTAPGELLYTTFNRDTLAFEKTEIIKFANKTGKQTSPVKLDGALAAIRHNEKAAELIFSVSTGNYMGEQAVRMHTRGNVFDPYDGAGIWRGELPKAYLYAVSTDDILKGPFTNFRKISLDSQPSYLNHGWSNTAVNLGSGREKDFVSGSVLGNLCYYRNTSKDSFIPEPMTLIPGPDGIAIRHPTVNPSPIAYPNHKTGLSDLLVSCEGWFYYYQFTGQFDKNDTPVYKLLGPALQHNADLTFGTLPVINVVDWDGDGKDDIIAGNSPGKVLFSKNIGTETTPRFANPVEIKTDGKAISIQPGYRGSIQGPLEARWGYTCPQVADWTGNGLPDILLSSSVAEHLLYVNMGTAKEPLLSSGQPLYCKGMPLFGTWRVRPAVGEINEKMAYIMLDDQDQVHLYWKIDNYNLEDGGKLRLTDQNYIDANYRYAGGTGRLKLQLDDWDGDGHKDLLIGTMLESSVPSKKRGFPSSLGNVGAMPLFLKNSGKLDLRGLPIFEKPQVFLFKGEQIRLLIHSCSPVASDINGDGKLDLLVGEETGRVMFYAHNDITLSGEILSNITPHCEWQKTSVDNSWHNNKNWWRNTPDSSSNATLGENCSVVLTKDKAYCKNLSIKNNSSLLISTNQILEVAENLTLAAPAHRNASIVVDGGILKTSDLLIKPSDNSRIIIKEGSIVTPKNISNKIQQYINESLIIAESTKKITLELDRNDHVVVSVSNI
ncbi:hypothetical protein SMSP2_01335 [Limihaloglobus sulfuriphilus]|uniref:FG-GAP repeat n=1 Tax=Limihaloglobus sulfuriphilus TaxID=1851148 RepID=A0A1Q2ME39_9BACT|nr:VCBS repeat-containing protein [Limihaloglobus sulfuriphilus]AQQ70971.1 hypothetical protein SMSP2_01335 [Limihaloglobus sulfuriphilus]